MDLGAEARRQLGGPVPGGRVDHEQLVDQVAEQRQPLDDRADRVGNLAGGQHDRDGLALSLAQQLGGNSEWWKERTNARVLWHPWPASRRPHPWAAVLEAGRGEELVVSEREDARPGVAIPLPHDLHPALLESLDGIEALWSHQADVLEAARRGHTIVTTGTASGKSLAFNLPVLDTLASDIAARAIYLYPTKALAQDQARALARLGQGLPASGDLRRRHPAPGARDHPPAVEPDPDQPRHAPRRRAPQPPRLGDVLANLAWVVVDEAHVYRGVFGSHVGNVLRRLRRLARAYGAEPRFVLTSATIANPSSWPSD